MDIYEEAVMYCLTANGETFVSPQCDLGKGWSRPDFVALRPPKMHVYVVEVTTAGDLGSLLEKLPDRERQWFVPLRSYLAEGGLAGSDWSYGSSPSCAAINSHGGGSAFRARQVLPRSPSGEDAVTRWLWDERVRSRDFDFEGDLVRPAAS
jgi:hypothetical protein